MDNLAYRFSAYATQLILYLAILLPLVAPSVVASRPRLSPMPDTLLERLVEEPPIKGTVAVGFAVGVPEQAIYTEGLYVHLPQTQEKYLCLSVTSIDGYYVASATYDIKDLTAGTYTLSYPTKHNDLFLQHKLVEFAFNLTLSNNCSDPNSLSTLLAVRFGSGSGSKHLVSVNAGAATHVSLILDPDKTPIAADCEPVNSSLQRVVFDYVCVVPFPSHSSQRSVLIKREAFGEPLKSVPVILQR